MYILATYVINTSHLHPHGFRPGWAEQFRKKFLSYLRNRQQYVQKQITKSNLFTVKSMLHRVLSLNAYYFCFMWMKT